MGVAQKNEIENLFDAYATEGNNLERWTAERRDQAEDSDVQPMTAWGKRVLLSQQAADQASENVRQKFNFEKEATRLGMRMTIDGSDDDKKQKQGLAEYSSLILTTVDWKLDGVNWVQSMQLTIMLVLRMQIFEIRMAMVSEGGIRTAAETVDGDESCLYVASQMNQMEMILKMMTLHVA